MDTLSVRLKYLLGLIIFSFLARPALVAEQRWVEVKSPHFSVITDAGEKRGREVAMRFEQMRAVFGTMFGKNHVNIPIPMQIVAFRNSKEMSEVAPIYNGKPTEVAGLFSGTEDRTFIMLDMSVDNPYNVVFHEYAHQLMNGNVRDEAAPWFDEGFAEYFSTIEVDDKKARVGKIPEDTFLILRQMGWMRLPDLFRVQQYSQAYNESGNRRTVFYAESAMVVHYLYDKQLVAKLPQYFDLVNNKRVPVEDAIQQTFGMSAAQFDKVIHDYVSTGVYLHQEMATPADIAKTGYITAPVTASDAAVLMADIHLHSRDYQGKAISEFEAILKTDPNSAAAARGLGYAYMQKRDYTRAQQYFQQALNSNSHDPRVLYYSAMLQSRQGGFSRSNAPEMIKTLQAAIALDPDFADPYSLLAFAYVGNGEAEKGLESMKKAISLSPRNLHYYYNLSQMLLANRKYDDAIAVLHALQKTGNPELAMRVNLALSEAERLKSYGDRVILTDPGSRPDSAESSDSDDSDNNEGPAPAKSPGSTPESTQHNSVTITLKPGQKTPTQAEVSGTLVSVDCSKAPKAVLTVTAEGKTLKFHTDDPKNLLVMGGKFSCSLADRKIKLNYLNVGEAEGIAMILQFLH